MKITILGMTGRVGSQIAALALQDKNQVTGLVRSPEIITVTDDNLTVIKGNVLDKENIEQAVSGADAVISALNTDGDDTLSKSMPLIIEAMEEAGVNRLVSIGTAGILESRIDADQIGRAHV